jgi:peptidoglycan-associated lipoprotein
MNFKPFAIAFAVALLTAACGSDTRGGPAGAKGKTSLKEAAVGRPSSSVKWREFTNRGRNGYSDQVFFAFDRHDLSVGARATIKAWSEWLRSHPDSRVLVEGHADERGTREYNLALGARRATAIREYLIALGVRATRVRTLSYGKERPAVAGSNESMWAKNRRGVARPRGGGS